MKIAYISDVVYPFVKGGAEKRIYEMGKRLAAKDEVHVFGVKWWKGKSDIELEGAHIHGICKPSDLYIGSRRSFKEALRFAMSLRPILKYDFDIIDCNQFPYLHCFPAYMISRFDGVGFVITWHEWWGRYWYDYIGAAGIVGALIERATVRVADQIIAVSQNTAENLRRYTTRVSLVPNGVDTGYIDSIPAAQCDIDALFVGRLIPEKHVDTLIRAVPPDCRLCIIGEGPEKRSLMQLADRQRKHVTFASSLSYSHIIGLMKAAKSLVLPSSREGFGIVALEALACGTPVVTSDVRENAAAGLIDSGENGFKVGITPVQIRSALLKVDKDKMGQAARAKAVQFDWTPLSEKLRGEYQSLVKHM
ncbi:MAG: glycosyltransferase family 4 protein [Halobacteriota archaeon]